MTQTQTTLSRRTLLASGAALLAGAGLPGLCTAQNATAQERPPLKIIVGFPPGGSADMLARAIGDAMREDFSSVLVENRPGAAGRLAIGLVKNAKPDGQTLIIVPSPPMVLFPYIFKKLDYDPARDFTPISQLALGQFGITAGPASGVASMREMVAKLKVDPKSGTFGTPGEGSGQHILGMMLGQAIGVPLAHVPFTGGAPANTALLGGHIGYKIDAVLESIEYHRAGKVRVLAVAGDRRDPQLPEVPTLKESGIPLEATFWFGMYGPAGLPRDIQARLQQSAARAVRRPDVAERLTRLGFEPMGSTGAELAAVQRADFANWEKPAKAAGVNLD